MNTRRHCDAAVVMTGRVHVQRRASSFPLARHSPGHDGTVSVRFLNARARASRRIIVVPKGGKEEPKSGSFGDELLDFMYAGKKLRKWYGQEGQVLPSESGSRQDQGQTLGVLEGGNDDRVLDAAVERESILVLFPDEYPMAEQVLLQLILLRAPVSAMVKDVAGAKAGYGPYVTVVQGDDRSLSDIALACRSATAVVVCGKLTKEMMAGVEKGAPPHVVLLSGVGFPHTGGLMNISTILNGSSRERKCLEDASREETVVASGLERYTVIRVGSLTNEPGGSKGLEAGLDEVAQGSIPREDAALCIARTAMSVPPNESKIVSVAAGDGPVQLASFEDRQLVVDRQLNLEVATD